MNILIPLIQLLGFKLELLGGVNLLQFIFVALRLDGLISWQWQMVFIPLWSLFGVAMIAVSYSILLAIVFLRSTAISSEQRRSSLQAALGYTSLIVPAFVSLVKSVSWSQSVLRIVWYVFGITKVLQLACWLLYPWFIYGTCMLVNDVEWILGFADEETRWRYRVALCGYLYSTGDSPDISDHAVV